MKRKGFICYNAHPYNLRTNDCVKRAVSLTTGMAYELVDKGLSEHKKVTGVRSFYNNPNPQSYVENVLKFPRVKINEDANGKRITVGKFARQHPSGRYILSLSGHWTACIDGTVYDIWDTTGEAVLSYYEITRFEKIVVEKKFCYIARTEGNNMFVTVYDGNGMFSTKKLSLTDGREYIENLYARSFFNFDEMGEYI